MEISISNRAQINIENIIDFSLKISTNYANRIVNEIYSTIYSIKDAPYIGRYVPELLDKHYRERICEKYRIIYYVSQTNNTIYVRYIFCSRQNSNSFFKVHEKEIFDFLNRLFN